jgi:hypothetical protein
MTMQLIETKTLGTAAASIEFTSIPQDGTDLLVLLSGRGVAAATLVSAGLFINSVAADTSWRRLSGNGSSASSGSTTGANDFLIGDIPGANATSNTFSNNSIYIPNYTGSQQKSLSSDSVAENNATTADQNIIAGLCTKTAAVTSLTVRIYGGSSNLAAGSTVSLYKVTKGSGGATVS